MHIALSVNTNRQSTSINNPLKLNVKLVIEVVKAVLCVI